MRINAGATQLPPLTIYLRFALPYATAVVAVLNGLDVRLYPPCIRWFALPRARCSSLPADLPSLRRTVTVQNTLHQAGCCMPAGSLRHGY